MNYLKSTLFITLIILGSSSLKPVWAQGYVGNLYIQSSTENTIDLTNAGDEISERFTMPNNLTSNTVTTLYISNNVTGTPNPTYSVGIQTDNGSGQPSGFWAIGPTSTTLPNNPWNTVTVTPTTLGSGVTYHLVILVSTAATFSGQFIFWTPDNFLIPNSPNGPVTDTELNYLTNVGGGGSTVVGGGNPTFGLGFSDGSVYGTPYANAGGNLIYETSGAVTEQAAQLFAFSSNVYVGSVGAYVEKFGAPPDNLRYYLVNTSLGTTVVNGTLTTPSGIPTDLSNQWVNATFTATTLSGGITYQMILESNGSNSTAGYEWIYYETSLNALNPATYGGSALSAETSTNGGNTWNAAPSADESFELGLVATPTPTFTPTNTPTNTPTLTPTNTPTNSPTNTPTNTPTPTITSTFTFIPTITPSPTSTFSPTPSPTPLYDASDLGEAVLAPVPAKAGTNVCLYFDKPPVSCTWEVFNVLGQKVATLSYAQLQGNCWNTSSVPPGVYFAEIKITYQDGTTAQIMKKAVISP